MLRDGRGDQAEALLRRVLQSQPANIVGRQMLVNHLMAARRHGEAAELLRTGLVSSPDQVGWAINLARIHAEQNDYPAAWEVLLKSLPYAQQNPDFQAFCGTVLQRLNRSAEASAYYRAALRLKPHEGRWWVGYGIALEAEGKAAEAQESFQRARSIGKLPSEVASFLDKKLR